MYCSVDPVTALPENRSKREIEITRTPKGNKYRNPEKLTK